MKAASNSAETLTANGANGARVKPFQAFPAQTERVSETQLEREIEAKISPGTERGVILVLSRLIQEVMIAADMDLDDDPMELPRVVLERRLIGSGGVKRLGEAWRLVE